MKALCTLLLFSLLTSKAAAATESQYFNGTEFEKTKAVQMIGTLKTAKDSEREDQVGRAVESSRPRIAYCYEKMLTRGPLENVQSTIYFTVGADGKFGNVTADINSSAMAVGLSQSLVTCVSRTLYDIKVPADSSDRTFRFLVSFTSK